MENGLFSGDRIRQLLLEVAESLKPGKSQSTVLIVGGSLLALRGLRMATQDVTDIITMWPLLVEKFPTARSVVEAYYSAFPLEEPDEYLRSEVIDLAKRAGLDVPP